MELVFRDVWRVCNANFTMKLRWWGVGDLREIERMGEGVYNGKGYGGGHRPDKKQQQQQEKALWW